MATGTAFRTREGMHAPAVRRVSPGGGAYHRLGALFSPSMAERKSLARAIRAACAGPGLLLHRQPPVPAGGDRGVRGPPCSRFFALPLEQKMRNHYL